MYSGSPPPRRRKLMILVPALIMVALLLAQFRPETKNMLLPVRAFADDAQIAVADNFLFSRVLPMLPLLGAETRAQQRIKTLEARIRELEYWREQARLLSEQLLIHDRLAELEQDSDSAGLWARALTSPGGPFASTRILAAGANQGVGKGFAVIADGRLIGQTIRVGAHSSRLLLLDDYTSHIPVMGLLSRDRAIMIGAGHGRANLAYIAAPEQISAGETWITSGDGGMFRRGHIVGTVHSDNDGKWYLNTRPPRFDFVLLIPPPRLDFSTKAPLSMAMNRQQEPKIHGQ